MSIVGGRTIDRILISTMPRSGTVFFFEMISRLFDFTKVEPKFTGGFSPKLPEWDPYKFDETFDSLSSRQVLCAHYQLNNKIKLLLADKNLLGIYLYRDPRDVAVSAALYIKYALSHHALHGLFSQLSDSEAITFMLSGGTVQVGSRENKSNDVDYIYYEGMEYFCRWGDDWLSHPNVAKVRYEDYVTEGSDAIKKALLEVDVVLDDDVISAVSTQMSFEKMAAGRSKGTEDKSSHFRKGVIGDHKNHFNGLHRAISKKQFGDYLIKLGYEQNFTW